MQLLEEKIEITNFLYKEALKSGYLNDIEKKFILNTTYLQFSTIESNLDLESFSEFYHQLDEIKKRIFVDTSLYEKWLFSCEFYSYKLMEEVKDGKDYVELVGKNNDIINFFQLYQLKSEILLFYKNLIICSSSANEHFIKDQMLALKKAPVNISMNGLDEVSNIIDESCTRMDKNCKKLQTVLREILFYNETLGEYK